MGRQIVTARDLKAAAPPPGAVADPQGPGAAAAPRPALVPDAYLDRIMKYIPADIIAAYLAMSNGIAGLYPGEPNQEVVLTWVLFFFVLALTPLYLRKFGVEKRMQLLISSVCFVVWVVSLPGGPFNDLAPPGYRTLLIGSWTLLIGLIEPKA